ncbi:uncharacterized protein EI97DRAFT_445356 [Westerdykella ornata]|uniref:SMP-30/Gluconolactonase/LRE-like region domain-containing protein n=1 Tax=Westerdykella ornata TaxID=318751 RepID=A0A6A6JAA0_WESOR|nr:uncharacterized protein EI97DRAFT_445356 [Westerdykella ornata]KAF2272898.1 hypothetical protein EI97DRAFT_445356 [Westerdykella ornata]
MHLPTLPSLSLLPLLLLPHASAHGTPHPSPAPQTTTKTLFTFPNSTWLENIHVTPHNTLLVSVIETPELHLLDPATGSRSLVTTFQGKSVVMGITEYGDENEENYAVLTGNYSQAGGGVQGTWEVWGVKFLRDAHIRPYDTDHDQVQEIQDPSDPSKKRRLAIRKSLLGTLPTAKLPNGFAALNEHTLLISESTGGKLLSLDIRSKSNTTVLADDTTVWDPKTATLPIGINGLKVFKSRDSSSAWVYYTNTFLDAVYRVRVSAAGPQPKVQAKPQLVAKGEILDTPDDLAVSVDGKSLLVARPLGNAIERVHVETGKVETVVSGAAVEGATSVSLGRGEKGKGWVYVSSSVGKVFGVKLNGKA